jgi:hypothetical protein
MHGGDLARRWIVANVIVMVAMAVCGLLAFGIRNSLGVESAEAALPARTGYVAAEAIMTLACLALYARLTGAVLRRIGPALPGRGWLVIHLVIGLVAGAGLGALLAQPGDSEPIDWNETGAVAILFVFALIVVAGTVLGAIVGGHQALILRRVAHDTGAWIAFSALANGIGLLTVAAMYSFLPTRQTLATEVVVESVITFAGIVSAIVMLPALRRLCPRMAES